MAFLNISPPDSFYFEHIRLNIIYEETRSIGRWGNSCIPGFLIEFLCSSCLCVLGSLHFIRFAEGTHAGSFSQTPPSNRKSRTPEAICNFHNYESQSLPWSNFFLPWAKIFLITIKLYFDNYQTLF